DGPTTAEIYGNIFNQTNEWGAWDSGNNGLIAAFQSGSSAQNWKVYNNTFINITSEETFGLSGANPSGNQARNNYYYNSPNHGVDPGWSQSFEHFQSSGSTAGTNASTGSGNPFVNLTGF